MFTFTEDSYEKALLSLFSDMGYKVEYGPDIYRDYNNPIYEPVLGDCICRLNPTLPSIGVSEEIKKLKNIDTGDVVQKNEQFMNYLPNGVEVSYYVDDEIKNELVYLTNFENADRNDFRVVNQWTFVEKSEKRADLIVFLNGRTIYDVQ